MNAGKQNHTQKAPSTKTDCGNLYSWIKKTVAYGKISPKMVNHRIIAGNTRKRKEKSPRDRSFSFQQTVVVPTFLIFPKQAHKACRLYSHTRTYLTHMRTHAHAHKYARAKREREGERESGEGGRERESV